MANLTTLNQLVDTIRNYSMAHPLVNDFGYGDIAEINTKENVKYPLVWLSLAPNGSNLINVNNKITPQLSFNLLVLDQEQNYNIDEPNGDETNNRGDILSDNLNIVYYISDYLNKLRKLGATLEDNLSVRPVRDNTNDKTYGWNLQFTLKMKYMACDSSVAPPGPIPGPTPGPSPSCDPATVTNSDGSYNQSIQSGGSLTLPDTVLTIKDSNGIVISTINIPATEDYEYTETGICPVFDDVSITFNTQLFGEFGSGANVDLNIVDENSNQLNFTIDGNDIILNLEQLCPIESVAINVNNQLFDTVDAPDTFNIPVVNENGDTVGTIDNGQVVVQTNTPGPNDPNVQGDVIVYNNQLNNKSIQLFSGGKTVYENFELLLHNFSSSLNIEGVELNQYLTDNTMLYYILSNSSEGLNIIDLNNSANNQTINISGGVGVWIPRGLHYISDATNNEIQIIGARTTSNIIVIARYNLDTNTLIIVSQLLGYSLKENRNDNDIKYINNHRYVYVFDRDNDTGVVDQTKVSLYYNSSVNQIITGSPVQIRNFVLTGSPTINYITDLVYDGQFYYTAIRLSNNNTYINRTHTDDISNWGAQTALISDFIVDDIIYSSSLNLFILIGVNTNNSNIEIYTSTDASTWILRYSNTGNYRATKLYDGGTTIQTLVRGSKIILTTNDAINWTEIGSFTNQYNSNNTITQY